MKRSGIVLSLVIALINPVIAQSEAGAIFLLLSPGARAGGMGEANVAVADDAYASYWNPAGLGFLEGSELISREKDHVQDPYSFSCMPQVHGATKDALDYVEKTMDVHISLLADIILVLGITTIK